MKSTSKTFHTKQVDHIVTKDPIAYKKVDPTQFPGYQVNEIPIQQQQYGYVKDDLLNEFKKQTSSTTIVNVGIGQGKTTAIYEYIKYISDNEDYIIVLASPFITLVEKDYRSLTVDHHINPDTILLYSDLESEKEEALKDLPAINYGYYFNNQSLFRKEILPKKRIHVITINSLLGNPGESAFVQSTLKHDYLSALHQYCKSSTKKIVFILDEIHESVHNFANPFIYNIMRWKGVTHQAILLTATYTEPVNIVVKHFAYLIKDTIHIIQTDRIKKQLDPANLHLCYTNDNYSSNNIDELEVIKHIVEESDQVEPTPRQVQILSFSRKIARELYNVSDEWFPERRVQLSTSSSREKFDPTCSNIGTNFKTGVNMTARDLYFIVLPCKYTEENLSGEYGIFSDGVPSIVQSIARMRTNGDVYIIIPPVAELINDDYIEQYLPLGTHTSKQPKVQDEANPDDQVELKNIYELIYNRIQTTEKDYIRHTKKSKVKRPDIQYPKLDTFILERGQKFLVSRYLRHGKHVAPYIIWSAFHDQFVNTNLKTIFTHEYNTIELQLTPATIFDELTSFLIKTGLNTKVVAPLTTYNEIIASFKSPIINNKTYQITVVYNKVAMPRYFASTIGQLHAVSMVYYYLTGQKFLLTKEMYLNYHLSIASRSKTSLNPLGKAYLTIAEILDKLDARIKAAPLTHVPKKKISAILINSMTPREITALGKAVNTLNADDPLLSGKFAFFKNVKFNAANIDRVYNHIFLNFLYVGKNEKKMGKNNNVRCYNYLGPKFHAYKKIVIPKTSFVHT